MSIDVRRPKLRETKSIVSFAVQPGAAGVVLATSDTILIPGLYDIALVFQATTTVDSNLLLGIYKDSATVARRAWPLANYWPQGILFPTITVELEHNEKVKLVAQAGDSSVVYRGTLTLTLNLGQGEIQNA
jgi:hypothetical protein